MKTLKDGERIRFEGLDSWADRVTFGFDAYSAEKYLAIRHDYDVETYNRVNRTKFGVLAFSIRPGCCLMADYPGKAEEVRKEKAEFEGATVIADGELVEAGGWVFQVEIVKGWNRVSDPVHFQVIGEAGRA